MNDRAAIAQRKFVYRLEAQITPGRKFASFEDTREFARAILASEWWKEVCPKQDNIAIVSIKGTNFAWSKGDSATIELPYWAWTDLVVCHELAHQIVRYRHGPWHDHDVLWIYWFAQILTQFGDSSTTQRMLEVYRANGLDPLSDRVARQAELENGHRTARALVHKETGPVWGAAPKDLLENYVPLIRVTRIAEERGKTIHGRGGLVEAFGGDRGLLPPKAEYWRPLYVAIRGGRSQRFLPKECLEHLGELVDKKPRRR